MSQLAAGRGADTRRRRADAERNIEAIIDTALDQVLVGGELNMAAVARAAGLSRVTLYAHFPTRDALLDAVLQRAVARINAVLDRIPPGGTARDEFTRLLHSSWQFLARHRHLYTIASAALAPAELRSYVDPVLGRVENLVARGQAEGDFRSDLPRPWLVATIYTLLHLAAEELNAGRLRADEADEVVAATVLAVLDLPAG